MKKKTKTKYIVTLILFSITFVILMSFILIKFHNLTERYSAKSTASRLDYIKMFDEGTGSWGVGTDLVLYANYEPAFDNYWDFAQIENAYLRGIALKRAIKEGDASKQSDLDACIAQISAYIGTSSDQHLNESAQTYLDDLKQ